MLRSPLQRLENEHVECSLQQLNPVFILVFLVHRCRHSTPKGGRSSTSFCIAQGGQNLAAERKERYPYAAWPIGYCRSKKQNPRPNAQTARDKDGVPTTASQVLCRRS